MVFRLTRNSEDAQDVVQDTWLKVHAQLGRIRGPFEGPDLADAHRRELRDRLPSLLEAARGGTHDPADLERRLVSAHAFAPQPDAERLVLAGEIETRVGQTMSCLTAVERAAFMLRHVEGMSISEIGAELGLEDQRDETLHFPRGAQDARGARAIRRGLRCTTTRHPSVT